MAAHSAQRQGRGLQFYDDGARCARCEGSYVGLVLLLAFLALLGAGAVGVCVAYGRRLKRLAPRLFEICFDSGRAKIVWATMQIVGSIEWRTRSTWSSSTEGGLRTGLRNVSFGCFSWLVFVLVGYPRAV